MHQEERIMVLQMLQEGKISVDDATKLLETLDSGKHHCDKKSHDIEDKIKKLSKCVDGIAKDLGDQFGNAYKNIEPKFKKSMQCVFQKTADVMHDLSKKLSDTSDKLDDNNSNN